MNSTGSNWAQLGSSGLNWAHILRSTHSSSNESTTWVHCPQLSSFFGSTEVWTRVNVSNCTRFRGKLELELCPLSSVGILFQVQLGSDSTETKPEPTWCRNLARCGFNFVRIEFHCGCLGSTGLKFPGAGLGFSCGTSDDQLFSSRVKLKQGLIAVANYWAPFEVQLRSKWDLMCPTELGFNWNNTRTDFVSKLGLV